MTIINCQHTIALFIEKLDLFIHNLSKGDYYQFQDLISDNDEITTADTHRYIDHLDNLKKDLESGFNNVLTIKICNWIINPFTVNVNKADAVDVTEGA